MKCQVYRRAELKEKQVGMQSGDFVLTHGDDLFDRLIQIFTMSKWNHAALVLDSDGSIVELVSQGVKKHNLSKYDNEETFVVRTEFSDQDRAEIVAYAARMLQRHERYGFATIA